jgi:hypothetical protein
MCVLKKICLPWDGCWAARVGTVWRNTLFQNIKSQCPSIFIMHNVYLGASLVKLSKVSIHYAQCVHGLTAGRVSVARGSFTRSKKRGSCSRQFDTFTCETVASNCYVFCEYVVYTSETVWSNCYGFILLGTM